MNSEAKKAALKEGVKRELVPLLRTLGFTYDRRPKEERGPDRVGIAMYIRRRGDITDEINFFWARYGWPLFSIDFWTDDPDRVKSPFGELWGDDRIYDRFRPLGNWLDLLLFLPGFGLWMSVKTAIWLAKRRLIDLDSFLRTGEPSKYVRRRRPAA